MNSPERTTTKPNTKRNILRLLLWTIGAAAVVVAGSWIYQRLDSRIESFDAEIVPGTIAADGTSSALLEIRLISRFGNRLNASLLPHPPEVEIVQGRDLVKVVALGDGLRYRLISGFNPGTVVARVLIFGAPGPIETTLELTPSLADRNRNGYPDAIDLSSESDRTAFRRWFTTIALGQLTHMDDRWHDRDCAGLIRYCYREALKRHDNAWLASRRWLITGAIPDVKKYNYPNVPLVGTRVFNVGRREPQQNGRREGAIPAGTSGTGPLQNEAARGGPLRLDQFSDFAEAARLKDNSLVFVSRDPAGALPGDVIFYLNDTDSEWPYHSMIYLGGGSTVYHTGPDGDKPGIVKRLTLAQLGQHPNPRWHPTEGNPYFLGFYRWRILG